jgi:cytochrome P450
VTELFSIRGFEKAICLLLTGLRLASPVPAYLWRIVPETGFTVAGHFLPPKTSIGMSAWIMHYDPSIFPEPQEFKPERWIGDKGVGLDRFLVPFSKGTRQCGGINLAWMEIYVGLATLVRRFELDVVEKGKMKSAKKMEQKEYFVGLLTVRFLCVIMYCMCP